MKVMGSNPKKNRHGAAGARGAHNSEDTGSRPVAGIFQFARFKEAGGDARPP
jgi:hypothetical protein